MALNPTVNELLSDTKTFVARSQMKEIGRTRIVYKRKKIVSGDGKKDKGWGRGIEREGNRKRKEVSVFGIWYSLYRL